jgi:hypothetical protein
MRTGAAAVDGRSGRCGRGAGAGPRGANQNTKDILDQLHWWTNAKAARDKTELQAA